MTLRLALSLVLPAMVFSIFLVVGPVPFGGGPRGTVGDLAAAVLAIACVALVVQGVLVTLPLALVARGRWVPRWLVAGWWALTATLAFGIVRQAWHAGEIVLAGVCAVVSGVVFAALRQGPRTI